MRRLPPQREIKRRNVVLPLQGKLLIRFPQVGKPQKFFAFFVREDLLIKIFEGYLEKPSRKKRCIKCISVPLLLLFQCLGYYLEEAL
jgi:hypothetical protein